MQGLNQVAGYPERIEWDLVYNGLKPKLKELWALLAPEPETLEEKYNQLARIGAATDRADAITEGESKEEKDKKKNKKNRKDKNKGDKGDKKAKDLPVPRELWNQRKKSGLCMKCGSNKHLIKDCKSEPNAVDIKEGSTKSTGQKVSALQTSKIYDSENDLDQD